MIHRFPALDSTNVKARELAVEGAPVGTAVLAERQTAGRGRGDHRWHSPSGGVYLSVLLEPARGRPLTDLVFLGGVAMARTVRECLPPSIPVSVKWPNDCLVSGKKVGGVLGEAVGEARPGLGVLGLGLNVTTPRAELEPFRENAFSATALTVEAGGPFDVAVLGERLAEATWELARRYAADGFLAIQRLWERHCLFLGKRIRFAADGDAAGPMLGTCLGIDDDGALVVSTPEGERRRFHSGELLQCYW